AELGAELEDVADFNAAHGAQNRFAVRSQIAFLGLGEIAAMGGLEIPPEVDVFVMEAFLVGAAYQIVAFAYRKIRQHQQIGAGGYSDGGCVSGNDAEGSDQIVGGGKQPRGLQVIAQLDLADLQIASDQSQHQAAFFFLLGLEQYGSHGLVGPDAHQSA